MPPAIQFIFIVYDCLPVTFDNIRICQFEMQSFKYCARREEKPREILMLHLGIWDKTHIQHRVVRGLFGPKRKIWEQLHPWETLHNLYSSPNTVRDIWRRRISWAGYVAFMRNKKSSYKIMVQNLTDTGREEWIGFHLA